MKLEAELTYFMKNFIAGAVDHLKGSMSHSHPTTTNGDDGAIPKEMKALYYKKVRDLGLSC